MADPTKQDIFDWLGIRDPGWIVPQVTWNTGDLNLENIVKDFLADHFDNDPTLPAGGQSDEGVFTATQFRVDGQNIYVVPASLRNTLVDAINAETPPVTAARAIELIEELL